MNVRAPFAYDVDEASLESGLLCEDVSLAKQSFAEEVDINTIVRRFNLTGQLPENVRMPQYADFEGVMDFHDAMNAIRAAQESFDAMPADVRTRFHNNPAEFVDFVADPANRREAEKLGLVEAPLDASPEALAAAGKAAAARRDAEDAAASPAPSAAPAAP